MIFFKKKLQEEMPGGLTGSAAAAGRHPWLLALLSIAAVAASGIAGGVGSGGRTRLRRAVPRLTPCLRSLGVMPTPASRRRQRYAILHITVTSPHSLS